MDIVVRQENERLMPAPFIFQVSPYPESDAHQALRKGTYQGRPHMHPFGD